MDEFIKKAASETGVDEAQVKNYVGMVLDYINKQVGEDTTKEIETKVAGAKELVAEARSATPQAEAAEEQANDLLKPCMPVLEMLRKLIDQFTGGKATSVKEVLDIVEKAGINPAQGAEMIQKLLEFLKEKLGPETVDQIVSNIPGLTSIGK